MTKPMETTYEHLTPLAGAVAALAAGGSAEDMHMGARIAVSAREYNYMAHAAAMASRATGLAIGSVGGALVGTDSLTSTKSTLETSLGSASSLDGLDAGDLKWGGTISTPSEAKNSSPYPVNPYLSDDEKFVIPGGKLETPIIEGKPTILSTPVAVPTKADEPMITPIPDIDFREYVLLGMPIGDTASAISIESFPDHSHLAKEMSILYKTNDGGERSGRIGKQIRLRRVLLDKKESSKNRGWVKQEINSIRKGKRRTIRNPPGSELAHERGREASKGYNYEHSNLQDIDLHKIQHKYDNFGRKNKERPIKNESK